MIGVRFILLILVYVIKIMHFGKIVVLYFWFLYETMEFIEICVILKWCFGCEMWQCSLYWGWFYGWFDEMLEFLEVRMVFDWKLVIFMVVKCGDLIGFSWMLSKSVSKWIWVSEELFWWKVCGWNWYTLLRKHMFTLKCKPCPTFIEYKIH